MYSFLVKHSIRFEPASIFHFHLNDISRPARHVRFESVQQSHLSAGERPQVWHAKQQGYIPHGRPGLLKGGLPQRAAGRSGGLLRAGRASRQGERARTRSPPFCRALDRRGAQARATVSYYSYLPSPGWWWGQHAAPLVHPLSHVLLRSVRTRT